jgi:hypothetical protein
MAGRRPERRRSKIQECRAERERWRGGEDEQEGWQSRERVEVSREGEREQL